MAESPQVVGNGITLDTLPEDILINVFDCLSLRDQTRLSSCCSRLHSINRTKVSAKFDAVVVFWKAKCLMQGPTNEEQFVIDECFKCLFERARTNAFEITIKPKDDRPYLFLSQLLKTLQYNSLEIDFTVSEEHNIDLLQSLILGRDLKQASLTIKWSRAMFEDVEKTRQFLLEFPPIKSLDLTWIYWGINSESLTNEVITDEILVFFVNRCSEALLLGEGDCSVEGLMRVLEKQNSSSCQLVRVTVRSEVAQEFHRSVSNKSGDVTVILGKNSNHEGIAMTQIVMTKQPDHYEKSEQDAIYY